MFRWTWNRHLLNRNKSCLQLPAYKNINSNSVERNNVGTWLTFLWWSVLCCSCTFLPRLFYYFHIIYRNGHVKKHLGLNSLTTTLNLVFTYRWSFQPRISALVYFTWLFKYSKTMKESTLGRLSDCPFSNPSSNLVLIITEHRNNKPIMHKTWKKTVCSLLITNVRTGRLRSRGVCVWWRHRYPRAGGARFKIKPDKILNNFAIYGRISKNQKVVYSENHNTCNVIVKIGFSRYVTDPH